MTNHRRILLLCAALAAALAVSGGDAAGASASNSVSVLDVTPTDATYEKVYD